MGIPDVPLRELYDERSLAGRRERFASSTGPLFTSIHSADGMVSGLASRADRPRPISIFPVSRLNACSRLFPICRSNGAYSGIRRSRASIYGSISQSRRCRMPRCSIARFSGCSTKVKAGISQVVVSASRSLLETPRQDVIDLIRCRNWRNFLPDVKKPASKKPRSSRKCAPHFRRGPAIETLRPGPATPLKNFFLAGDWTRSGWPATMEGAVRSELSRGGSGSGGGRQAPTISPAGYRIIRDR